MMLPFSGIVKLHRICGWILCGFTLRLSLLFRGENDIIYSV